VHYAEVTDRGTLKLEDGQEFKSPSRAATVAVATSAVDGWHAWVVDKSGKSLDTLRAKLLDAVATRRAQPDDQDNASSLQRRHTLLKETRAKADAGNEVEITVRDLIALWNARSRGHRLDQRIEADLANHGLATSPNFRKVTLDTSVKMFALASQDSEQPEESSTEPPTPETVLAEEGDELDVGLTVGNLPSALGGVASVAPTATIQEAITMMLLNDFSQLAVMSGSHSLRGAITWKSIAQARHANPDASFGDAIIEANEVNYDKYLVDVLSTLEQADFVFVRNEKNAVCGIVTNADVVHRYGELATPFFFVGELDQALRYVIAKTFTLSDVIACCDRGGTRDIRSVDELTMGDYQRILENSGNWAKMGWPLDRGLFVKRLDELREIRNDIMHFNPDPMPADAMGKLRSFTQLLRSYCD
jgi:CBS domain-containing protein